MLDKSCGYDRIIPEVLPISSIPRTANSGMPSLMGRTARRTAEGSSKFGVETLERNVADWRTNVPSPAPRIGSAPNLKKGSGGKVGSGRPDLNLTLRNHIENKPNSVDKLLIRDQDLVLSEP